MVKALKGKPITPRVHVEEGGKIHYRRAFNLLLRLNAAKVGGPAVPWPPWMLSIQTHKVLGLR